LILAPAADGLPDEGVIDEPVDHLGEVDGGACAGERGEVLNEPGNLLLPDVPVRQQPGGAGVEQLRHTDLPELTPPLAVGGEGEVSAVVGECVEGGVQVPVGELEVVCLQDLLCRLRRR